MRKPIECVFEMLKKYPVLQSGVCTLDEDGICQFIFVCGILHNRGIKAGDVEDIEEEEEVEQ